MKAALKEMEKVWSAAEKAVEAVLVMATPLMNNFQEDAGSSSAFIWQFVVVVVCVSNVQ